MAVLVKKSFVDFVSLFFAIALIFAIGVFALILYNAYDENIKPNMQSALEGATPSGTHTDVNVSEILDDAGSGIGKLNPLFPLLMVGIFAYVIVLAFMARSHPAFFFIGIIVLGVGLILAGVFSNVYEGIGGTSAFANTDSEFSIISVMMNNLPLFTLILFVVISIILYALRSGPPQGGAY